MAVFSDIYDGVEVVRVPPPRDLAVQPVGFEEIVEDSKLRARSACEQVENADFCIGIESGLEQVGDDWFVFTCASVLEPGSGMMSHGFGPAYQLPNAVVDIIFGEHVEMEMAMDEAYGVKGLGEREGAVGLFSRGLVTRRELTVEALKMALIPFLSNRAYIP